MGRATRLIPLRFIPLAKFACRQTGIILPFCYGSNGFFASSHLPFQIKLTPTVLVGVNFMGRATRFELATFGTTNRRSNQLSYARHNFVHFYAFAVRLRQRLRRDTEFS